MIQDLHTKWLSAFCGLLFFLILLGGCQSNRASNATNDRNEIASPYYSDYEFQSQVYHFSNDSSEIYIKLSTEMLARRRMAELDGCYALRMQLMVIDSLQRVIDTVKVNYKSCLVPESTWLLLNEKVLMPKGRYKILIELADVFRSSISKDVVVADKRNDKSSQNFRLVDLKNELIFGNAVVNGQSYKLESRRNSTLDSLEVVSFQADTRLPPPPFSSNAVESPDLKLGKNATIAIQNGAIPLHCEGSFQWVHTRGSREGFVVRNSVKTFPLITESSQLHPPLRYISTKVEYEEMAKSSYSKPLVDQFWFESGATKERAKELIRIYYSRVERANRLFSNHTEGWRTDRGMIYVVFGQPLDIEQVESQERWYYGSKSDNNAIVFTFNKVVHPLGQDHYVLKRDPYYKTSWEAMVNSWRNGRIRE